MYEDGAAARDGRLLAGDQILEVKKGGGRGAQFSSHFYFWSFDVLLFFEFCSLCIDMFMGWTWLIDKYLPET